MDDRVTIFLSAAEASGDLHAANLIRALRRRLPGARFVGVGGERMAEAKCEMLADLTHRASMLGAPVLRLGYWVRTIVGVGRTIRSIRPDVHVPVDSPAMNWHLAAASKACRTPVFYYIAPQVWAWAPWRVKKMARLTDHVGCILPFEQRYLRDRGVEATYVGHPLFDSLPDPPRRLPDFAEAWYEGSWRVVLAPGSRREEIRGNTRAFLAVAERIRRRWSKARCIFTVATEDGAETLRKACRHVDAEIAVGQTRKVLSRAHFAVAKSGTVTLEAAWFGVPMVIPYRTSWTMSLLYHTIGRWVVRTPYLSLVNILAGRRIVPEVMPWHGNVRRLRALVMEVMDDLGYLFETRRRLLELVKPLRVPPPRTASDNAADLIVDLLRRRTRR
jgi:lipid-A-disaccharide synthase